MTAAGKTRETSQFIDNKNDNKILVKFIFDEVKINRESNESVLLMLLFIRMRGRGEANMLL